MSNTKYLEGFADCKRKMLEIAQGLDIEFKNRAIGEFESVVPFEEGESEFLEYAQMPVFKKFDEDKEHRDLVNYEHRLRLDKDSQARHKRFMESFFAAHSHDSNPFAKNKNHNCQDREFITN